MSMSLWRGLPDGEWTEKEGRRVIEMFHQWFLKPVDEHMLFDEINNFPSEGCEINKFDLGTSEKKYLPVRPSEINNLLWKKNPGPPLVF